jgi:replicative DNA helicase
MVHVSELLVRDLERVAPPAVATGIVALDSLWGGLLPGRMVLITAPPGEGKTTFAVQLAGAAAVSGRHVRLDCPRESPRATAARLVAALGSVSYSRLLAGTPIDKPQLSREILARMRLSAADLEITFGERQAPEGLARGEVLVVDDAQLGVISL